MKRITSLLLTLLLFLCPLALAEESGFPGVWIENDGYGTLVILADGTARMDYYDGTVTECHWALTDEGAKFTDGMWLNSPMELPEANTLRVADGWMVFTREGFLPVTDPALLLGAEPVGEDGEPCTICGETIPKEPLSGGGISAIVTASTVVASAGGFSLFWFVIKKKSLAELLSLLFK